MDSKNAGDAPGSWTPEAMLGLRNVSQVRVAPDGRRVAFVVSDAMMTDDKSEFVTQIHVASSDGSGVRQVTLGPFSAGNPRWSPDGKWLAFTARRGEGESARTNVYRLPVDGPGEAEALLESPAGDVGDFRWSPDGKQLAVTMTDPPEEDEAARKKSRDDWRWAEERIRYARLYVVAAGAPPRCLTAMDRHVTSFDWSPDGAEVVFAHTRTPRVEDWTTSQLARVRFEDAAVRLLETGGGAAMQPLFSPDGRRIAFTRSDDPPRWAYYSVLQILAEDGSLRALPETFDGQPALVGWSADGGSLYVTEARGARTRLSAIDVATGAVTPLDDAVAGLRDGYDLNAGRTHFGLRAQAPDRPVEAFISPCEPFAPVAVSALNAALADLPLGQTRTIRWRSADGWEIEGLLTYPVGYVAGTPAPLLLVLHGGPAGVFLESFVGADTLYPLAAFSERGYAILKPNPRGSSGYGRTFRQANHADWGGGDFADVMAGVDHLIATGIADPARLGVMGWSYGGFLTSWTITHTDRFKAASVGAAVTHLTSFTGTTDITGFLPSYFGGPFWESEARATLYQRCSPLAHVAAVVTPTLVQHPEADERVPISQGYELFQALRQRGVETRMLVLPRQGHGPSEPRMLLACLRTNLEWFTARV